MVKLHTSYKHIRLTEANIWRTKLSLSLVRRMCEMRSRNIHMASFRLVYKWCAYGAIITLPSKSMENCELPFAQTIISRFVYRTHLSINERFSLTFERQMEGCFVCVLLLFRLYVGWARAATTFLFIFCHLVACLLAMVAAFRDGPENARGFYQPNRSNMIRIEICRVHNLKFVPLL